MADPISIKDRGDRQKRLGDHIQLIAGVDPSGNAVLLRVGTDGSISVLATSEMAAEATAAAPAYTEGQNAPLSQDLSGNLRVKDTAVGVALGATTGAAVVTDANGTIQQYLRGLVKQIAAFITVKVDQTTPGLTNAVQTKQYAGVPSSFAIQTADQTVFTLAAGEVGFIQNLSADAPLAVKKGAGASTISLNFILAKSTVASDGTGGAVKIDDWIGVVSVAKMTGTASYLAWKQAVA